MKTTSSKRLSLLLAVTLVWVLAPPSVAQDTPGAAPSRQAIDDLLAGRFQWTISQPLVSPAERPEDPCYSVKDPSVVFHQGQWHLFLTIRSQKRTHQIEYLSFADWKDANAAPRHLLKVHETFFCAPQVFYFTPHKKWYLICQASDKSWKPEYGTAYSTTTDIADPASWSKLKLLGAKPAEGKAGLDFWIICDAQKAHLFFTTNDGHLWRAADPAGGLSRRLVGCQAGDRGGHLRGEPHLQAQGPGQVPDARRGPGRTRLAVLQGVPGGPTGRPLEAAGGHQDKSFASMANVRPVRQRWTDSISHGELLRAGVDQRLDVDPADLRFLFQGVSDAARSGKPYGQIPWRLGILESAPSAGPSAGAAARRSPSEDNAKTSEVFKTSEVYTLPSQEQKSPWERIWADKTVDAAIRGRIAAVDPQRMSKTLFYLAKDPLPYRKLNFTLPGHAKNTLYEADDYLAGRLESWGYRVRREGVRVQAFRRDASKPKHAQYSPPMPEDPWYTAYNLYAEKKGRSRPERDHPRAGPQGFAELGRFAGGQRQRDRDRRASWRWPACWPSTPSERTIRFLFCNEEHVPWTSVTAATERQGARRQPRGRVEHRRHGRQDSRRDRGGQEDQRHRVHGARREAPRRLDERGERPLCHRAGAADRQADGARRRRWIICQGRLSRLGNQHRVVALWRPQLPRRGRHPGALRRRQRGPGGAGHLGGHPHLGPGA